VEPFLQAAQAISVTARGLIVRRRFMARLNVLQAYTAGEFLAVAAAIGDYRRRRRGVSMHDSRSSRSSIQDKGSIEASR